MQKIFSRAFWKAERLVLLGSAVFAVSVIVFFVAGRFGPGSEVTFERDGEEIITVPDIDDIIQHGQEIWTERRAAGDDLANGPCLDDGEAFPGWAIDLVREERIDNLPENQCLSWTGKRAHHLVELSLMGDLVRILPSDPRNSTVPE